MSNAKAQWIFSLITDCPDCGDSFDLTDDVHFDECEHPAGSEATGVEVECPACNHTFLADFSH